MLAENILENFVHDHSTIDVEDVLEMKKHNKAITQGQPYCVLVTTGMITTITKEARELAAGKEFKQQTVAKAILVHSIGHRLVARIYMKVNQPHITTRIFSDREEAMAWLRAELKKAILPASA